MAKRKNDWKQLLSAGALVVAVVGTLILGWALQGGPAEDAGATLVESTAPDQEPDSSATADLQPAPSTPPAPPPSPKTETLESRSARDLDRLASLDAGWTLQFISACDEAKVRLRLAELQGHDQFYLVPVTLNGRRCFRLCWGVFETKPRALSARGIPSSLTAINNKPMAIPVDKVIR